jgi:hypothetical protein
MSNAQKDLGMPEMLTTLLSKLAHQYRCYQNKREIMWTERHLETTRKFIAEMRDTERALQAHRLELKAAQRSLGYGNGK